ncbi:MAG: hypothetical protein KF716_21585, partial [Anaerolineae bacterium]|nr:hypothetical protein [Anaerolineae bacterium]
KLLKKHFAAIFTTDMIGEVADNLTDFDKFVATELDKFVVFFEPPSLDSRIVNQFGFFSIMSDAQMPMDNWLKSHPDPFRRIIVPHELKWEIRNKLDQTNITERALFPGLDGLSLWLKRYYSVYPSYPNSMTNTENMKFLNT